MGCRWTVGKVGGSGCGLCGVRACPLSCGFLHHRLAAGKVKLAHKKGEWGQHEARSGADFKRLYKSTR